MEGHLRTEAESQEAARNQQCFDSNSASWAKKMENFPKYVRRQDMTRFLALYELFKQVLHVKGSVVECGVWHGFGVLSWAKLSAILEPVNLTRRVYGFDTFGGFPPPSGKDIGRAQQAQTGDLCANSRAEIEELAAIHDSTRFLGHIPKVQLIEGDATQTIPAFIEANPHLLVSLLFLDFDLYEPTKVAIEHFLPRMPRGSIIAFDELDNPRWPGETLALLETIGANKLKIERFPFDPYIGFAVIT